MSLTPVERLWSAVRRLRQRDRHRFALRATGLVRGDQPVPPEIARGLLRQLEHLRLLVAAAELRDEVRSEAEAGRLRGCSVGDVDEALRAALARGVDELLEEVLAARERGVEPQRDGDSSDGAAEEVAVVDQGRRGEDVVAVVDGLEGAAEGEGGGGATAEGEMAPRSNDRAAERRDGDEGLVVEPRRRSGPQTGAQAAERRRRRRGGGGGRRRRGSGEGEGA